MSFSYSQPVNGVFTNPKDEVRFLLMDTIEGELSLSDEEIFYLLSSHANKVYLASAQGALHLAISYAQQAAVTSKSVGDLSLSLSYENTADNYRKLADTLRKGKIDTNLSVFNGDTAPKIFATGQFDDYRV